jgi:hypothetical protein
MDHFKTKFPQLPPEEIDSLLNQLEEDFTIYKNGLTYKIM